MELTKLHRERAVDAVYQALREAIISNTLKPGERLNVDDLARRLGVSLTPIRGAIQQLATEGLVEIRPRSGTFVAALHLEEVAETFRLRCAIECLAAESALENLTIQDLRSMRELVKHLKKVPKAGEERDLYDKYRADLHQAILNAAKVRRTQEIYDSLNAHIRIATLTANVGDLAAYVHQEHDLHEAIVDAFESRELARVAAALRAQMEHTKTAIVEGLRAVTPEQSAAAQG